MKVEELLNMEKRYMESHKRMLAKGIKQLIFVMMILMIKCFLGGVSHAFKWSSYENRNSPIPEMCDGLDRVLDKAPIYDEGKVLYRFCTIDDRADFQVGEIYHAPHYITTTKDNWKHKTNVYIITAKKDETNERRHG